MSRFTEMPRPIRQLPRDAAQRPIPWLAEVVGGKPDFRVTSAPKIVRAVRDQLCWICGQKRPNYIASFVVGPMCAVNHVSSEPPSHHACAVYAATACPFLANPQRSRREAGLPEVGAAPAGVMIARNPGVALVWRSRRWKPFQVPSRDSIVGGVLFDTGEPVSVEFYTEGRRATRDEVLESFDSGCPALRDMAAEEGEPAIAEFEMRLAKAMELVPA